MNDSEQTAGSVGVGPIALLEPKPRLAIMAPLMLATAAALGDEPWGGLRPLRAWSPKVSGKEVRNDPRREKTSADLAAIAKASERRARREAARKSHANQSRGSNV